MDHPPSGVSASALSTHRRQLSVKNASKPAGLSAVSLLVTNLRLLDLDLLPDWPHITTQSLGNQDARTRIKCTEYALYQLFRLYDPATTADKLQPFFPPLEPLQSVNLRAALYRCLNELKKSGVLARDVVVRKTMLDDCQGDRFWEVCLAFSAHVVRKQTLGKKQRKYHGRSIAESLGTASTMSNCQKESMLPLAIAHKAALSRVLQEKEKKRNDYARLHALLREKESELLVRKVQAQTQVLPTSANPDRLRTVEQAIEKSWIGSTDLKEALIGGDVCASGDGILLRSFDTLWKANEKDSDSISTDSATDAVGFLHELRDNVVSQNRRLRRWQDFHEKLLASKPRSVQTSNRSSTAVKHGVRFDRHRGMTVRDASPPTDRRHDSRHERHDSVLKYDEILTAMRDELRQTVAKRGGPTPVQPIPPIRRAKTQPVTSGKSSMALDTPTAQRRHHHQRSPSQTAVPVFPRMGSRTPSRSRSYQQPKVVSQREPIPLKSELFSPLKEPRRSSAGSTSILASPVEQDETAPTFDNMEAVTLGRESSASGRTSYQSSVGLGISSESFRSSMSTAVDSEAMDSPKPMAHFADSPSSTSSETPRPLMGRTYTAPPRAVGLSLAERTRLSMVTKDNFSGGNNTKSLSQPYTEPEEVSPVSTQGFSLAERTRQSIFLAPQPSPRAAGLAPKSAPPVYPVNQFETPSKPRKLADRPTDSHHPSNSEDEDSLAAHDGKPQGQRNRDITPLEQLMSPDADYNSVFKSRPRVPRSSTAAEVGFVG